MAEQKQQRRKPKRVRDERTAFHEAGHAVAGNLLGFSVVEVSIIPESVEGYCRVWLNSDIAAVIRGESRTICPSLIGRAFATIQYLLAGGEAEQLHEGRRVSAVQLVIDTGQDHQHAFRLADTILGPNASNRDIHHMLDDARSSIRRRIQSAWPEVVRTAERLLSDRIITTVPKTHTSSEAA